MEQVILQGSPTVAYGYGDGSGYGYGNGYGYGYGSGSGDGSGTGYGDGSGYGYGYGSGDGSAEYWSACLKYFSSKWPQIQQVRMASLEAAGAKIMYWRSTQSATAANGGSNKPVYPGLVETAEGPLKDRFCKNGCLHATLIPPKWKGERWWIVAMLGELVQDDDKFGALQREILGECL
jgi:hypothetical protein